MASDSLILRTGSNTMLTFSRRYGYERRPMNEWNRGYFELTMTILYILLSELADLPSCDDKSRTLQPQFAA